MTKQELEEMRKIKPNVVHHIGVERKYQKIKWGESNPHTVAEWLLILEAEIEEAKIGWVKGGDGRALEEITQIAAVAVAILEEHGPKHEQSHIDRIMQFNQEQGVDAGLPI